MELEKKRYREIAQINQGRNLSEKLHFLYQKLHSSLELFVFVIIVVIVTVGTDFVTVVIVTAAFVRFYFFCSPDIRIKLV